MSGKATVVDPEVARILRLHDFVIADEGIPDGDSGGEGEGNASRRRHSHGRFALIIHKVLAFFPTAARPRYSRVCRLWRAHVPLAPFPLGERPSALARDFEILRTVGTGTFSRVKMVRHSKSRFVYAAKRLRKREQVRADRVQALAREIETLGAIDHPNVAALVCVFQDEVELVMVQECVYGGELFNHLNHRTAHRAGEGVARFYAAQLVLALEHLHTKHDIVYRDLRQENVLIGRNGYLKLVDFGNARVLRFGQRARTLCGAPESTAPEMFAPIGESRGLEGDPTDHVHHGKSVDWWALGVLCYELLVGFSPFYSENPMDIYARVLASHETLKLPGDEGFVAYNRSVEDPSVEGKERDGDRSGDLSDAAMLFVRALLEPFETRRLGTYMADTAATTAGGAGGDRRYAHDAPGHVRQHSWFDGIDWPRMLAQSVPPPLKAFVPRVVSETDSRNFELYDDSLVVPSQPLKKARAIMHWKRWCGKF